MLAAVLAVSIGAALIAVMTTVRSARSAGVESLRSS